MKILKSRMSLIVRANVVLNCIVLVNSDWRFRLDTNIMKNGPDMFPEIPNFFSKYLEKFLNISKIPGFIS